MWLPVNLRHLELHSIRLQGELSAAELDLETGDEMVQVAEPLQYNIEVEKLEEGLLLQGDLHARLQCLPLAGNRVRLGLLLGRDPSVDSWTQRLLGQQ